MRRCLAAGSVLDVPVDEVIRSAAAAGFDGVGLRVSDHHAIDARSRRDVRRLAEELGIEIHDAEVHRIGSDADIGPLLDAAVDLGPPASLSPV